jgi:hypothetical protein
MHTFLPYVEITEGWFTKLNTRYQKQVTSIDRYSGAFVTPNAPKVKRFIIETSFMTAMMPS